MSEFTLSHLVALIRDCAGESDVADLSGDIADMAFDELGYDSLALLELSARIKQTLGVEVAESEMRTPGGTLRLINEAVSGREA
ncbi:MULTISPECIES: acyl carrier protein [unclassified Streptomyces]|uniref:acyl carrier protein n=1 Tax=unclassified Streptomyces TaxID=2593676 RepID=UPI000B143615|nr:acyl carrier protein [Streptomyces sp. CNQ-509]